MMVGLTIAIFPARGEGEDVAVAAAFAADGVDPTRPPPPPPLFELQALPSCQSATSFSQQFFDSVYTLGKPSASTAFCATLAAVARFSIASRELISVP